MVETPLHIRLKQFLNKHEDEMSTRTRSSILETIDMVEFYETLDAIRRWFI
jgi:hypothetical protein